MMQEGSRENAYSVVQRINGKTVLFSDSKENSNAPELETRKGSGNCVKVTTNAFQVASGGSVVR